MKNTFQQNKSFPDFILFTIGFFFGVLNNLRHRLFGYVRPRAIADDRIAENIAYDQDVIATLEQRIKHNYNMIEPFTHKRILEVGPGQDLGTGIILLSKNASSYAAIDRFPLAQKNTSFYTALEEKLVNKMATVNTMNVEKSIALCLKDPQGLNLPYFHYHGGSADTMDTITGLEGISQDIIFSQSVLQTVEDVDAFFDTAYSLLSKDGVMCHEIDLRTMMSGFRTYDPLVILRYSENVYQKLLYYPGAPNRLRSDDYVNSARRAGFRNVHFEVLRSIDDAHEKSCSLYLNGRYRSKNRAVLKHLTGILYAQK